MSNSPQGRTVSKMPDLWGAYEQCAPEVRKALQEGVISYDASAVLRYQQKHGAAETVRWIKEEGDRVWASKNWMPAFGIPGNKTYRPPVKSSWVVCGVSILRG